MAHDVFISHSTSNRPVANAVCASLESAGIRCWIAPRDVMLERSHSGEIKRRPQDYSNELDAYPDATPAP